MFGVKLGGQAAVFQGIRSSFDDVSFKINLLSRPKCPFRALSVQVIFQPDRVVFLAFSSKLRPYFPQKGTKEGSLRFDP